MTKINKSVEQWQQQLTEEEFRVCRLKGTETPFSGAYNQHKEDGDYCCTCCNSVLFDSAHKFDSGSGWPSFWQALNPDQVQLDEDASLGMRRIEVSCAACGAHLGHVFPDGPKPSGERFCINSVSLQFKPRNSE